MGDGVTAPKAPPHLINRLYFSYFILSALCLYSSIITWCTVRLMCVGRARLAKLASQTNNLMWEQMVSWRLTNGGLKLNTFVAGLVVRLCASNSNFNQQIQLSNNFCRVYDLSVSPTTNLRLKHLRFPALPP